MKKKTEVKVIPDETGKVTVEVLAVEIKSISDGVKKLRAGRLNDKALHLLIQNAAPSVGGRYQNTKVGMTEIRAVLAGMENLEREFLK